MVAMVIMRGSVIVLSRLVDWVQIRQGLLKRRVFPEEDVAVLFALVAVGTNLVRAGSEHFAFLDSPAAVAILAAYVVAYGVRLYVMNWYKNTRAPGVVQDNRAFFAWEQCAAGATLLVAVLLVANAPAWFSWQDPRIDRMREAIGRPDLGAALAGVPFGLIAFFSVFLFLFHGRTATFAGLVSRLTSLLAGTVATVATATFFGGPWPDRYEWASVGALLVSVAFLARAERRRILGGDA
jgi:hypothetical protein